MLKNPLITLFAILELFFTIALVTTKGAYEEIIFIFTLSTISFAVIIALLLKGKFFTKIFLLLFGLISFLELCIPSAVLLGVLQGGLNSVTEEWRFVDHYAVYLYVGAFSLIFIYQLIKYFFIIKLWRHSR